MRRVFSVVLLMFSVAMSAQETFDERMKEVELELNKYANTSIPGLLEVAQFSVSNASIQELIRGMAEAHQLNVSISPQIQVDITNNFTNVVVKDLIFFLCRDYHLNLEFTNNIMSFSKYQDAPVVKAIPKRRMPQILYDKENDRLSMDLIKDSLSVFVRELSRISGKNVLFGPTITDQNRLMNGYVSNVTFGSGILNIAMANGLYVDVDSTKSFFLLNEIPQNNVEQVDKSKRIATTLKPKDRNTQEDLFIEKSGSRNINIEAINIPIADIIKEAASITNNNYIFFSKPEGNSYIKIQNINFDDLLLFLLKGTSHTFLKQDNVNIIGNRSEEGFRATRLVKFQYRAAWEIEKSIPDALKKNIQVLPFEELNALILSGNTNGVDEVEKFLKDIDQPVPNILIDVIVIDIRKSHSLETGISFFLGDSTVQTKGQMFPGVDMTIGSNTINSALDKLSAASSINLGRVKTNFYMKLKALEQNGDIKIRSTPKLSTLNGHDAVLTIGESVYYEEKTQNVTGGVNPIITTTPRFSKVDANLTIKIKPMVSGDENVTLDIEAEFADFIPPKIENAPPGNATRKFISKIRVLNEEMILLGGLEETSKENSGSGVPILSRIPVIKWFFSSRTSSKSESKLLILIKPTIVY